MFSWPSLALALLKLVNTYLTWARERELISIGQDREIARETSEILSKSQFAKETMTAITGLSEAQTDDLLKQLGAS